MRLCRIAFPPRLQRAVFRMVENEIPCTEFMGVSPCVKRGAVAFFVWLETLAVGVSAERLVHQPVGVPRVLPAERVVRLVAEAAEPRSVGEHGRKTELTFICRVDVEALKAHVADAEGFPVFKPMEDDKIDKARNLLPRQYLTADAVKKSNHLFMAPNIQTATELECRSHDPYHTEEVVRMGMSHEDVMDILPALSGALQLRKDSVAASGVHKQHAATGALKREARVIAARRKRIACAKHCYFVLKGHSTINCCCQDDLFLRLSALGLIASRKNHFVIIRKKQVMLNSAFTSS